MSILTERARRSAGKEVPPVGAVLGAMALGGLLCVGLARWLTGTGYAAPIAGLPDPGILTADALPLVQAVREGAGIAVVGLLFLRCCLMPGGPRPAHAHLNRMAARWALIWAAACTLSIVLTLSDMIGVPISRLPGHLDLVTVVFGTQRVIALTATLWVAVAVAAFGARSATRTSAAIAMVASAAALLPSSLVGHAGHHSFPLAAVVALSIHVVAASIWIGGLIALAVHLRRFPQELRLVVPLFSAVALVCVIGVGASGVVESAIMLDDWEALWHTDRGHLMLAKCVALVVLTGVGYLHRRRTLRPAVLGRPALLLRLAAGELVLMGGVVGLAVVLSTTA